MGDETRHATEMAEQTYPGEEHNLRGDALRHMLWQGETAQHYGDIPAAALGWGHEILSADSAAENAMDTHNNALGRQLGAESATREELLQKAMDAIAAGKAKTLK